MVFYISPSLSLRPLLLLPFGSPRLAPIFLQAKRISAQLGISGGLPPETPANHIVPVYDTPRVIY
nr:MAG TPA: hypothetical protein [Caudoviricetes sp.]